MMHTKEPWNIATDDYFIEVLAGRKTVLPAIRKVDADDDFRRIVACVNACADMSTEYLEQCGKMRRNEAGESITTVITQRDELLAALETLIPEVKRYAFLILEDEDIQPNVAAELHDALIAKHRAASAVVASVKGGA